MNFEEKIAGFYVARTWFMVQCLVYYVFFFSYEAEGFKFSLALLEITCQPVINQNTTHFDSVHSSHLPGVEWHGITQGPHQEVRIGYPQHQVRSVQSSPGQESKTFQDYQVLATLSKMEEKNSNDLISPDLLGIILEKVQLLLTIFIKSTQINHKKIVSVWGLFECKFVLRNW